MGPGDRTMHAPVRGLPRTGSGPVRLRVLTGLVLASALALLITVVVSTDHGPAPERESGDVVRVGVVDGQSVAGYLRSSRGELAALLPASGAPASGETWALVSLASYFPPDRLPALLGGAPVAQVYARAPLPGVRTQVVKIPVYRMPQDVVSGMQNAALARDQEQADYRKLAGKLHGDTRNDERLRLAYDTAARTAAAEAAAYRAACACVFAAVVRAGPEILDTIADRAEVRAVDPAPEVRRLDRTEFRPVQPEQTTTVEVAPQTSPPLPSSTGASVTPAAPSRPAPGPTPSAPAPEESAAASTAPSASTEAELPSRALAASPGASGR
ncbi:hypothetical protein [Symbioplanes lichenis]|uniref:hypothetical protein n=1 Tax=Symbioplanes lichenis TaxID=1629072 RepID=UPI00273A4192|nr:hypothetical protein [Actinoplanes lichenis]